MTVQKEPELLESPLVETSVNISGGGIGFVADTNHTPGDILSITLCLQKETFFRARADVLRCDSLPHRPNTCRIHGRFVQMSQQDRQTLIGHIMRLQRDHLHTHYSA
jgi:c-di-GMP-binding flagellar brake protein YcgR